MLGLLLIAPVLAANLQAKASDSSTAGAARMLEAQLPLRQKLPLAWALRKEIERTPDGEVPDLDAVFQAQGAGRDPAVAAARDELVGTIQSILTRAFRTSFLIAALLALGAVIPLIAVAGVRTSAARSGGAAPVARTRGRAPRRRRGGVRRRGARQREDFGTYRAADPCTASTSPYPGQGIDAAVQRIALSGLNGAACQLGTSREELVLSLDPKSGVGDVSWDKDTAADAIQSGTVRAIDDAVDRGTLPSWAGTALRFVVRRAPLGWLLDRLPF